MIFMIHRKRSSRLSLNKKAVIIAFVDVLTICIAFFAALWLRFDFQFNSIDHEYLLTYARVILPWCAISILVFSAFKLYSSIWSFVSTDELMRVLESYGVLCVIGFVLAKALHIVMPKSFFVVAMVNRPLKTMPTTKKDLGITMCSILASTKPMTHSTP